MYTNLLFFEYASSTKYFITLFISCLAVLILLFLFIASNDYLILVIYPLTIPGTPFGYKFKYKVLPKNHFLSIISKITS